MGTSNNGITRQFDFQWGWWEGTAVARRRYRSIRVSLRRAEELATTENHPAWTHMYLMMMAAQIGFAAGYLV